MPLQRSQNCRSVATVIAGRNEDGTLVREDVSQWDARERQLLSCVAGHRVSQPPRRPPRILYPTERLALPSREIQSKHSPQLLRVPRMTRK